jgi:hypothetical protein
MGHRSYVRARRRNVGGCYRLIHCRICAWWFAGRLVGNKRLWRFGQFLCHPRRSTQRFSVIDQCGIPLGTLPTRCPIFSRGRSEFGSSAPRLYGCRRPLRIGAAGSPAPSLSVDVPLRNPDISRLLDVRFVQRGPIFFAQRILEGDE